MRLLFFPRLHRKALFGGSERSSFNEQAPSSICEQYHSIAVLSLRVLMVDRQKPWIPGPTDRGAYDALVAAVSSTRMFLVQDLGPTQFLIAVEGDAAKFKVSLGSLVTCTCKV